MDTSAAGAFLQTSVTLLAISIALVAFMEPKRKDYMKKLAKEYIDCKKQISTSVDTTEMTELLDKIKKLEDNAYLSNWGVVSIFCLMATSVFTSAILIDKPIIQDDSIIFILFFVGLLLPSVAALALIKEFTDETKADFLKERQLLDKNRKLVRITKRY